MNDAKQAIKLSDVLDYIFRTSKDERKAISDAINACREDDILSARMEFRVGQTVMFEPRKRGVPPKIYGVITQKNPKTFHIRPEHGGTEWKVTASMVKKDDRVGP